MGSDVVLLKAYTNVARFLAASNTLNQSRFLLRRFVPGTSPAFPASPAPAAAAAPFTTSCPSMSFPCVVPDDEVLDISAESDWPPLW